MLPISIILVLGMILQEVSAFIIQPIRDTRLATDCYCNTNHRCKISTHQQHDNIFRDSNTQLYAEIDNGDNLEDVLKATSKGTTKKSKSKSTSSQKKTTKKQQIEISKKSLSKSQSKVNGNEEENEENNDYKEYNIPKTGISLSDQLETKSLENKERFETTLTPIVTGIISSNSDDDEKKIEFDYDDDGFPISYKEIKEDANDDDDTNSARHQGVARIDTISTLGNAGEEPVRWLVSLDDTNKESDDKKESFALIDLPPYSDRLVHDIRSFMDPEYNNSTTVSTSSSSEDTTSSKANLDVILLTNQQCIHYDTSPGVYVKRKSELTKWKKAFPSAQVIMYRLDIPRECREEVTQVLDGYGPWGWEEVENEGDSGGVKVKNKFVETGRPLTIEEWDDDTKTKVLTQGELPPDDQIDDKEDSNDDDTNSEEDELYSSEAIRKREEKYRLLAVYTPGSTFGSVTYILPQRGICCSGHALPIESSGNTAIEDNYDEDDDSISSTSPVPPQGPRLDYQGYLASSASRPRQMSSASALISSYIDRFRVVLPARGDIVFLDSDENTRKRELMESVGLYQKVSDIYNRLGIVE